MTETTFTARFFNEDGERSKTTIAPSKELLINTMKHLLLIFDDWDGFTIETNGKIIYKYIKDYDTETNKTNHLRRPALLHDYS